MITITTAPAPTAAVYKITNNRTGRVYIGSTKNAESRKKQHFDKLEAGKHENKGLQADYNAGDGFSFEIIQTFAGYEVEALRAAEQEQIEKHPDNYNRAAACAQENIERVNRARNMDALQPIEQLRELCNLDNTQDKMNHIAQLLGVVVRVDFYRVKFGDIDGLNAPEQLKDFIAARNKSAARIARDIGETSGNIRNKLRSDTITLRDLEKIAVAYDMPLNVYIDCGNGKRIDLLVVNPQRI